MTTNNNPLHSTNVTLINDNDDEHTYVPKRHSLHEVGMLQISAQIVSTQSLLPEMVVRFHFFGPAGRRSLALLLTKAGDVKSNPGPTTNTHLHSL